MISLSRKDPRIVREGEQVWYRASYRQAPERSGEKATGHGKETERDSDA